MQKSNKSFYLYFEPYVHVNIKNDNALIYNIINSEIIEVNSNTIIIKLLKKIVSKNNLYVIKLSEKELSNPQISDFIKKIREVFIGDLLHICSNKKPVQMMPMLKIRQELLDGPERIMLSLKKMTLFLNSQNNSLKTQNKQFLFCSSNFTSCKELDFIKIIDLFQIVKSDIIQLNISGSNIFHYGSFKELINLIKDIPSIVFYVNYENPDINSDNIILLKDINSKLNISVSQTVNQSVLLDVIQLLKKENILHSFDFKIEKEEDVEIYEQIITKFNIANYQFLPYYNGKNIKLFEGAVYLNKEDIIEAKPTQKDIFARIALNQFNFSKLFILPDNSIHSNLNTPKLGNLSKDSIYEIVHKELYHGKSWRRLRKNVKPCKSCIYNLLCPPLSNYEYAIGKNNLCHVWEE